MDNTENKNLNTLQQLTATYTDSENEDDNREDNSPDSGTSGSEGSQSQGYIVSHHVTPVQTPEKPKKSSKSLRLVSYHDDTVVSDDDDENPNTSDEKMDVSEESPNEKDTQAKLILTQKYAHYGFNLPPETKSKPPQELVDKIKNLYAKMENTNMDMNTIIQERKEFRNPSIYEKLIQFCDINEFGTNYPPEIYDPLKWGQESYYEELSKAQKTEMVKRQKERKDNDKIEQATAAARKVEEEAKKRKSKWDQPAPVKSNITAPALTTTVTGTKGTVISAFGSLPKKTNP